MIEIGGGTGESSIWRMDWWFDYVIIGIIPIELD